MVLRLTISDYAPALIVKVIKEHVMEKRNVRPEQLPLIHAPAVILPTEILASLSAPMKIQKPTAIQDKRLFRAAKIMKEPGLANVNKMKAPF